MVFSLGFVSAAASFQVQSFSCSPSEVAINNVFSCTAQINNVGDTSGSVSVATLYSDSGNWLESSSYPQASGVSVSPGQSTEVIFTGLRAIKSGNNGFTKIMLDDVTDTYVADNNKKVNVINVVVIVSDSASSAVMGGTWDVTSEVTAGGNIDVSLTWVSSSGGCSIGSQTNPIEITEMQDGNQQSRVWTVTQGTSGTCHYSISAAATGAGGIASKIDTTTSSVTCIDCPVDAGSPGGGSGSGSGGGGGATTTVAEEQLTNEYTQSLGIGESFGFSIAEVSHKLVVLNLTETTAQISIESQKQTFDLIVGEDINVDLDGDSAADVSVKLQSINIITMKATFFILPLNGRSTSVPADEGESTGEALLSLEEKLRNLFGGKLWIPLVILVLIVIGGIVFFIWRRRKQL